MLSVIIIAKNEERTIRQCLESVRFADEIIVLDSGSDDRTVNIAKEYTSHVYCTDWMGYGIQKQRALAYATHDWVLNLDADETVSDSLRQGILDVMLSNQADAYRIPIQMCFYGRVLRFSSSPTRHVRLFKRDGANYSDDLVHEKIVLPLGARIESLNMPIYHQSFEDVSHALTKMNRYSSYSASIRINAKRQPSLLRGIVSSWWMFLRCYVLQLGFLEGRAGFFMATLNAQGSFYRNIKQIYPDQRKKELSCKQG